MKNDNRNDKREKTDALTQLAQGTLMDMTQSKQALSSYGGNFKSPKKIIRNTDPLAEYIVDGNLLDHDDLSKLPYRQSAKVRGAVKASLVLESGGIKTSTVITPYDRVVLDGLITFWHSHVRGYNGITITAASLYRLMYGVDKMSIDQYPTANKQKIRISHSSLEEVDASIQKMMQTILDIELDPAIIPDGVANRHLTAQLAPIVRVSIDLSGSSRSCYAYSIVSEPILYLYGKWTNSLVNTDIAFSRFPEDMRKTVLNLGTRNLLDYRTLLSVSENEEFTVMLYEDIYVQRNATTYVQRSRSREVVQKFLTAWKNMGLVSEFKEIISNDISGSTVPIGVQIHIPEDQRKKFSNTFDTNFK